MAPGSSRASTPARTFPGMYTTHYKEAFDGYAEAKSSAQNLSKGTIRKGFKPGTSIKDYPHKMVNGMTADEALKQFPAASSDRVMMPVWDRTNSRWGVGESHKFDFHTVTFGSQVKMDHPDAPSPPKLFTRASQRIGEGASAKVASTKGGDPRPATLTVLGDWKTTVYDRPNSTPSPTPDSQSLAGMRPMTCDIVADILKQQSARREPAEPGEPFHPIHVKGDRTKVCGQAPNWFGIPQVTVDKNDKKAEESLRRWNALEDPPYWMLDAATERASVEAKVRAAQAPRQSNGTQTQRRPSTQQSAAASVVSRSSVRSSSQSTAAAIQAARAREKAAKKPFSKVKHAAKASARDMCMGPAHNSQMRSQRYEPRPQKAW
eukprot:jgi/Tetstr1/461757/TSEL_006846.t1